MVDSDLRLRKIREERKESGIFVAQILGISPQYYYDLEKGERNLSTEIASKLADHFSVSVDYLLGREEDFPTVVSEAKAVYNASSSRTEIQSLIDLLKDASKEDIDKVIKIYKALKEK